MHPPTVAAAGVVTAAPRAAAKTPPPPPRILRQGWLKCRLDEEGGTHAAFEDVWCTLDSDGVLSFYRARGSGAASARVVLREAALEEHPEAAPGDLGLTQLGWALKRRRRRSGRAGDAEGAWRTGADRPLQLRAPSVRERAVWLAALSPYLPRPSGAAKHQHLFAFMDDGVASRASSAEPEDDGRSRFFHSLPRPVRASAAGAGASAGAGEGLTASLRKAWRASLHPAGGDAEATGALRRRPSLRELVRRAGGRTQRLSWTQLPEVVEAGAAGRLSAAQAVLESLRFALAAGEAAYNAELAPLAALAKRSVGWHDATPVYARRTLASVLEKVKKCSDGTLNDMEQMWQKRLTFDGILGVMQKHLDKFDIFITYSSHLHELSNVIRGAKVKKSEVAEQAYCELYDLERVYLPLLRLTVIRKILQQMRGALEVTNSHLDHFHCKRTLTRITEVLEDCYKVLTSASDSTFVSELDKKLNECCDASTRVTFPEVFNQSEINPASVDCRSLHTDKESDLKSISTSVGDRIQSPSNSKPQPEKRNIRSSHNTGLNNKLNHVYQPVNKCKKSCDDDGQQILVKRPDIKSESNLTDVVSVKVPNLRHSTSKLNKSSLSSKVASTEKHIIMNSKRISIVEIPLHDTYIEEEDNVNTTYSLNPDSQIFLSNEENNNVIGNNVSVKDTLNSRHSEPILIQSSECNVSTTDSSDFYDESTSNSDHSGSTRSTLCGGSRHDSSSEGTLNDYDVSVSLESEMSVAESAMIKESSPQVSQDEVENSLYYETSPRDSLYLKNELYCSSTSMSNICDKKKMVKEEVIDNNYDYVYVTDGKINKQTCKCIDCSTEKNVQEQNTDLHSVAYSSQYMSNSDSSAESNTNSDCEDNIYEDVEYVDMNSQSHNKDVTKEHNYDSDSNENYDDICMYVKPDAASLRSSSERSRYSSDSGNLEDASHAYYNSLPNAKKSCSPESLTTNSDYQQDELHDESDSAIESGSDTGRLHVRKVCRTPSNASLSLQNMVRWKNAQPETPLMPRKALPGIPVEYPFEDAPLYQEYYRSLPSKTRSKEVKKVEEEKTYIYVEPQEHVYETLDEYMISRHMIPLTDTFRRKDKRERTDSRRTQWHETEEVIESGILEGMSAEQRKLQEAKFEIVTSEVSFLKSLNILEKYFINNIDLSSKDVLNEEDRRTLFMPIAPVRETSQCFLQDLVKVWEDDICLKNTQLGEVLLKYAKGRFRVYIAYCSRQVAINEVMSQLREKNKKFVDVIEKIEAKPVCQAFSLQSFLTQPMQRITRFPMLVNAILRHLPEGEESLPLWENILSTLQTVVTECNEAVRNAEITLATRKEDKKKTFWTKWVNK